MKKQMTPAEENFRKILWQYRVKKFKDNIGFFVFGLIFVLVIIALCVVDGINSNSPDKVFGNIYHNYNIRPVIEGIAADSSYTTKSSFGVKDVFDEYIVNTKDDPLSVRENPSIDSKKIGVASNGVVVRISKIYNGWGYICEYIYDKDASGNAYGWVDLSYCSEFKNVIDHGMWDDIAGDDGVIDFGWVWITPHGEKFHSENCRYIRYNDESFEISVEEAMFGGYEPCMVCGGY